MLKEILIAQIKNILNSFDVILEKARQNQTCRRKAVGCQLVRFENDETKFCEVVVNGPSVPGNPCSNVVGSCGCSHAEPRAILATTRMKKYWMVCTYSPCTNCANIIIDSKVITGVFRDILTEHDVRGEEFLKMADVKVITKLDLQVMLETLEASEMELCNQELISILTNAQIKRK